MKVPYENVDDPDWPAIYNYFSVLLRGGTPPKLRAIGK
jgi:hypothetical protein